MRREQFVNDASTTLNGAINNSVTSITVTDGSVFPSEGDFRALIDSEIVLVTARATNVLTVTRGVESTSAASHSDGATITAIVTEDGLRDYLADGVGLKLCQVTSNVGSKKPYRILDVNGNALTSSSFTWINQGSSSLADEPSGVISATIAETSGDWKLLTKSMPSPPFTLTAHLEFGAGNNREVVSPGSMGIGIRDSSSGRFEILGVQLGDFVAMWQFTSPALFNSDAATSYNHDFDSNETWVQFVDDNVDIKTYISPDGLRWFFVGQDVRDTWVANADQLVWAINPRGSAGKFMMLNSWVEE